MSAAPRSIALHSHATAAVTGDAARRVVELAVEAGVSVWVPRAEADKHDIEARDGVEVGAGSGGAPELAIVLGGDGSILSALRRYAGRGVPVFAVNYGAIGFLATVERDQLEDGVRRALAGDFDVLELPALIARTEAGEELAVNDISFHRRHNGRVAELSYLVEGEELGEVRCDGLVVSTPAGSTGYNLANGGPVLAWGVEGYVVSFIAPHTLTARALVVAPTAELEVVNRSRDHPVDMTTDGRSVCVLPPEGRVPIRFAHDRALLAQAPEATFYHRLRDKFGRLSH